MGGMGLPSRLPMIAVAMRKMGLRSRISILRRICSRAVPEPSTMLLLARDDWLGAYVRRKFKK